MKRRNFLYSAGVSGLGLSLYSCSTSKETIKTNKFRETCSMDGNKFSIYTKAKVSSTKIFHITDTHLSLDDKRGETYATYSKRMAGAYVSNKHFETGEKITSSQGFQFALRAAKEQKADVIALTGDIFSFPSEAAVEWAFQQLTQTGIPFAYVAGNHDWHYEGMEGSSEQLRNIWTKKHLSPMYQGNNPLHAAYDFNGIRFVCIDNSTYEILPEQLDFFKQQTKSNLPLILLMHIPLFMPGKNMGYGCAHPDWGEKSDRNFEIERREKWRKDGHTKTTFDFYDEVFNAPTLLAILAGHTHRQTLDVKNDIPQLVSAHNATGFYSDVQVHAL